MGSLAKGLEAQEITRLGRAFRFLSHKDRWSQTTSHTVSPLQNRAARNWSPHHQTLPTYGHSGSASLVQPSDAPAVTTTPFPGEPSPAAALSTTGCPVLHGTRIHLPVPLHKPACRHSGPGTASLCSCSCRRLNIVCSGETRAASDKGDGKQRHKPCRGVMCSPAKLASKQT